MEQATAWHLGALLDQAAQRYGERPFLIGPHVTSYSEAALETRRIAGRLVPAGVQRGDRVAIVTQNRPETILAAFATTYIGAIFTILHPAIKPYGLRQIFDECQPAAVILDESTRSLAAEVGPATILWAGNDSSSGDEQLAKIIDSSEPLTEPFPGSEQDLACLVYTSGSTKAPRGVMISHANLRFSMQAIHERLEYRTSDVIGLFLPLSFDYGLYQAFLAAQVGAALFVGQPELVGPNIARLLATHEISVLPAVPQMIAALIRMQERRFQPLPALRSITNTGERLPLAYIRQLQQLHPQAQIFVMYGLTECKRVSILTPAEFALKPDSVGRPLAGTEVFAVDEQGAPLSPGEIGELVVRGPHVAQGYWRAEQETRLRFRRSQSGANSELYTGDLGALDADGYLYLAGRRDALIKHKGFRINPIEIEAAACDVPGVSEAGMVVDPRKDELHLFVSLKQAALTGQQLKHELITRLEPFKIPQHITILDELPKTANRKIDYALLQQMIAEPEPMPDSRAAERQPALRKP